MSYPCEVVSTYATYLGAHLGAKARQSNPHYETEKELGKGRRRHVKRTISSSDEEDGPRKRINVKDANATLKSLPAPPKIIPKTAQLAGSSKVSFKAVTHVKSPVKVVSKASTSSVGSNNRLPKVVRKDKGTKAVNIVDIKTILQSKREEAKINSDSVKCTSPNWKASKLQENLLEKRNLKTIKCLENSFEKSNSKVSKVKANFEEKPCESEDSEDMEHKAEGSTNDSSYLFDDMGEGSGYYSNDTAPAEKPFKEIGDLSCSPRSKASRNLFKAGSLQLSGQPEPHSRKSSLTSFEKTVLVGLRELKEMLLVVSANQTKLNLKLLPNEKALGRPDGMPIIPVKSSHELNVLEQWLEDPENISTLSVYLSAFVSTKEADEDKSVKKVMPQVISNNMASKYSLKGQKGKMAFNDLKLWSAVKGAVLWKLETDLSVTEKAVGKWLVDAPWRSRPANPQSSTTVSKTKSSKPSSRSNIDIITLQEESANESELE